LAQPEKRLNLSRIKKHAFFDKIDWDQAYDAKLKMPKISLRQIVKS